MLSWYLNSTLHYSFTCNPANIKIKIRAQRSPSNVDIKIPIPYSKFLSLAHNKVRFLIIFLQSSTIYTRSDIPMPEGQAGSAWEPSKQEQFVSLQLTAPPPFSSSFSS
jgi:hypothetical protein